ncbi:MAG TPA: hypothetical protein VNP72_07490 [Longimicrobium sp.]|nr:hypothetical protein [Longimicrobium sp.]
MNTEPDVIIVHSIPLPDDMLQDVTGPLTALGTDVSVEDLGPQAYAGIEWLVPTAIVVLISKKYLDTMTQETAKDHYQILKASLSKLLKRTVGKEREIRIQYITSKRQKLSAKQPGAVSIYLETRTDQLVKFVFEDNLDALQHARCLDAIFDLIRNHNADYPQDTLTCVISEAQLDASTALLMRFDPILEQWYLWVPRIGPAE